MSDFFDENKEAHSKACKASREHTWDSDEEAFDWIRAYAEAYASTARYRGGPLYLVWAEDWAAYYAENVAAGDVNPVSASWGSALWGIAYNGGL